MVKHTPGPWEVDDTGEVYAPGADLIIADFYDEDDDGKRLLAAGPNARLGAAAPELLDVAIKAVVYYGGPSDNSWVGLRDDDTIAAAIRIRIGDVKAARAAVAKAIGAVA